MYILQREPMGVCGAWNIYICIYIYTYIYVYIYIGIMILYEKHTSRSSDVIAAAPLSCQRPLAWSHGA